MAWYKKYKIPFQSRTEKQYAAYILERTAPIGGIVNTLTAAADPFTTEEKNDTDIFSPLRGQTGYLRILDDTGGTLLEDIMPYNNTEKMVELWELTPDGADMMMEWRGFLAAKAFSQPWDGQKHVVEFPLKSVLAAMEDVRIDTALASIEGRLSLAISNAVGSICGDRCFDNVVVIDDTATAAPWMIFLGGYNIFFSDETIVNEGSSRTVKEGVSYAEVIKAILNVFGLVMREKEGTLYIAHYDKNGYNLTKRTIAWEDFVAIAEGGGNMNNFSNDGSILDADLLSTFSFRDKNNTAEYITGFSTAKVVVNINTEVTSMLAVPMAAETDDAIRSIAIGGWDNIWEPGFIIEESNETLYVQYQDERSGRGEMFTWFWYETQEYTQAFQYRYTFHNSCSKDFFVKNSIMSNPAVAVTIPGTSTMLTGCLPCRFFEGSNTSSVNLQSGLFLGLKPYRETVPDSIISADGLRQIYRTPWSATSITSPTNAYLVIDINAYSIYRPEEYGVLSYLGNWRFGVESKCIENLTILVSLKYGNYAWDGNSQTWVSCSDIASAPGFGITFDSGGIVTNKPSGVKVNKDGGFFIPVPSGGLTGYVQLAIWDIARVTGAEDEYAAYNDRLLSDARAMIISDITLGYYPIGALTASDRSENTYRKNILSSGFNGTKTITAKLGTTNNNTPSPTFLKSSPTVYIEAIDYNKEGVTSAERPEMHLLNRMAAYYNQVRRAFKATVESGADLFARRYIFNNRMFFGIDRKHDWREDRQEVKFIEIT